MRFKTGLIIIICFFCIQIVGTAIFLSNNKTEEQDIVAINDILYSCVENWDNLSSAEASSKYSFSVLDNGGRSIFSSREGLSQTLDAAIKNRDTILDIVIDEKQAGKLLVANDYEAHLAERNAQLLIFTLSMLAVQCVFLAVYILYLLKRIVRPFSRLQGFASEIATGNFDAELKMDKGNLFGAFSESFDIMRTELKKARDAEMLVSESKKQLIANLSHDIKTPIASIKAISEVSACKYGDREKEAFLMISQKADQVNALVVNLFSAALEDLQHLTISPSDYDSRELMDIISSSDYESRVKTLSIPQMLIYIDKQRLQQVVDNIISNSYKYAGTPIVISFLEQQGFLCMSITDSGGLIDDGQKLMEKFYRGKNSDGKEGGGLGLYISRYLMQAMDGDVLIICERDFFTAVVKMKIS